MMKKLRLTFMGRAFGVLPVNGCWTRALTSSEVHVAETLKQWLDGTEVRWGILRGVIYVTVGVEV